MKTKSIVENQKLLLSVSILSQLNKLAKDGIYLSRFFMDLLEQEYLIIVLENWEDEKTKTSFIEKLDQLICEKWNLLEIEINKNLYERLNIINEILDLFSRKVYSAMITLTLSQVDGLMKEITKAIGFYASHPESKKDNPNRMKYLDNKFSVDFFSVFEILNVDNRHDYELFKRDVVDMTCFNRHSILHGESFEFGHRINALKALLLLSFISELKLTNSD